MYRILSLLILVSFVIPVVAIAQDSSYSEERLSDIYKERDVILSESQKKNVQDSCTSLKTKLDILQNESDKAVRNRLILYSDIQKELKALELRISRQGADASELDLLIGSLDQQMDNFRELNQFHDNIVSDLSAIDCRSKPELFVAGLEELRQTRYNLLNQAKQLKSTIERSPDTTFIPLIERLLI